MIALLQFYFLLYQRKAVGEEPCGTNRAVVYHLRFGSVHGQRADRQGAALNLPIWARAGRRVFSAAFLISVGSCLCFGWVSFLLVVDEYLGF